MDSKSPARDETYYFPDLVTFLVGDRLFRVPKHMFVASSPIFSAMFSLPHGPNNSAEGQCDEKPVRLEQVDPKAFKTLLSLFYPLKPVSKHAFTDDEWLLILSLGKKWDMGSVVDLAVSNLQESGRLRPPAMKVHLGRYYNHSPWVVAGLMSLCEQEEPMSMADAELLGLRDAVRIAMVREWIMR
ncbi:hypothetical protein BU17DRAFT_56489 [Hysterangium stoloniferum]|nr:hypothetical protein BU17DRAFT_56482 [Hysterangium stoloniferum]KAF8508866.1 hypothetical protein BU17DRAFT_56489 [Hysterangium stoloniferum]